MTTPAAVESALVVSRLENSLRDAGINPDRIAAAVKIADVSGVKIDGTEVSGVSEAVESLKVESPEWFQVHRRHSAADTTPQDFDRSYRDVTHEEYSRELLKYNLRPTSTVDRRSLALA
jgi:hypothetical protein